MKKIMFNDKYGLTQAVLEGRKTMTRRVLKRSVRYLKGEILAIAQCYKDVRISGYPVDSRYDAFREADWGVGINGALKGTAGENNKMYVRADLMPHHIRITNVRTERLQDISDEDCIREGIKEVPFTQYSWTDNEKMALFETPRDAFAALVDKVSGNGTWDRNPWVFVYEFELI